MKDTNDKVANVLLILLLIREACKQNEHEDSQDKNRGLV